MSMSIQNKQSIFKSKIKLNPQQIFAKLECCHLHRLSWVVLVDETLHGMTDQRLCG